MKTSMLKTLGNLAIGLMLTASAYAQPTGIAGLQEGKDYELLNPPQPTSDPSRVEIIEFFWYGCPHCYHFEPDLNAWLRKKPANVEFIRDPAVFNERAAVHAKAFYTAQVLGVLDKLHPAFYEAIQNQKRKLDSEQELADFFKEHGVAEDDFRKAFTSFAVDTKFRQAAVRAPRYGVKGTPEIVINGKYRTSAAMTKSFTRVLEVMDTLIALESRTPTQK